MKHAENVVNTNNGKIADAFELLNEAAKQKKDEMKELWSNQYPHFKKAVMEGASQGKQILRKVQDIAHDAVDEGKDAVKKTAATVDKNVHENAWIYVGGFALASLVLGYFMGAKQK